MRSYCFVAYMKWKLLKIEGIIGLSTFPAALKVLTAPVEHGNSALCIGKVYLVKE